MDLKSLGVIPVRVRFPPSALGDVATLRFRHPRPRNPIRPSCYRSRPQLACRHDPEKNIPHACGDVLAESLQKQAGLRRIFHSIHPRSAGYCRFIVFQLFPLSFCLFHLKRSRSSALGANAFVQRPAGAACGEVSIFTCQTACLVRPRTRR